jgi:hypothetical protein
MGGEFLMYKFYKIDSSLYDNVRIQIDQNLYEKYIATGQSKYILPSNPDLINNGFVYFVLPDFIYNEHLIETYINQLTEITEQEYTEQTL